MRLTFGKDELFGVPVADIARKSQAISSDPPTCIVYPADLSHFFFEFEPIDDIDLFCTHARLAAQAADDWMPVHNGSILDWISENVSEFDARREISVPATDEPSWADEPLHDFWEPAAIRDIRLTESFKGMITCCGCGEPGCSSQYAIVSHWTITILFSIVAGGLEGVSILPAVIKG